MTQATDSGLRYLEGNYAPVREELTVADLPVTGRLPDYLDGRYLRNGPNPVGSPDPASYHWFTGSGMVHGIRLRDGRAEWYRNRWVRSSDVCEALGEQPRPGPVHAGFDFPANTNIIGHAGRNLAIVEAGANPYELTDELETIGPCDFDGTLPGGYTAHPLLDPATGELHAVSYFWGWGNRVRYTVVGADGRGRRVVDVPVHGSPMMHAFSLTERYVVVYDLPVALDLEGGSSLPYGWDPSYPARLGLLPREGDADDLRWLDVEPCYVFHPLNAYDDGADRVVLDVVRHPKMFDRHKLGPNEGMPTLDRWTIDLAAGKVLEERLDDRGQEFPRIDERLTGHRHRYGYATGVRSGAEFANAVIKHDFVGADSGSAVRDFGPSTEIGEFVFVPAGPDAAEDEGVLMGLAYDGERDRSRLAVLDAATLETVADVHLPTRVPHGFHGNWIPTA